MHVLFAIGAVGKATIAAFELALERLLARMRSLVDFEIFRSSEHFATADKRTRKWLLARVNTNVIDQLVLGLERLALSHAILPEANVYVLVRAANVIHSQVRHFLVI